MEYGKVALFLCFIRCSGLHLRVDRQESRLRVRGKTTVIRSGLEHVTAASRTKASVSGLHALPLRSRVVLDLS